MRPEFQYRDVIVEAQALLRLNRIGCQPLEQSKPAPAVTDPVRDDDAAQPLLDAAQPPVFPAGLLALPGTAGHLPAFVRSGTALSFIVPQAQLRDAVYGHGGQKNADKTEHDADQRAKIVAADGRRGKHEALARLPDPAQHPEPN